MAVKKATLRTVRNFVADRVEFNCNSTLSGSLARRMGMPYHGQLPVEFHNDFYTAMRDVNADCS